MSESRIDETEVLDELFGSSEIEKGKEVIERFEEESNEIEELESEIENERSDNESEQQTRKNKKLYLYENTEQIDGKITSIFSVFLFNLILYHFLDKILEARRDFEEALSKLKGSRRKIEIDSDSVVIRGKN